MADNKGIPQELIDRINELDAKFTLKNLTMQDIAEVIEKRDDETVIARAKEKVADICKRFPLY